MEHLPNVLTNGHSSYHREQKPSKKDANVITNGIPVLMQVCSLRENACVQNWIRTLIAAGSRLNTTDVQGRNVLMRVINDQKIRFVDILLQNANSLILGHQDIDGNTALHLAVYVGSLRSVNLVSQRMLQLNMSLDEKNTWNKTPLEIAIDERSLPIIKSLVNWKVCSHVSAVPDSLNQLNKIRLNLIVLNDGWDTKKNSTQEKIVSITKSGINCDLKNATFQCVKSAKHSSATPAAHRMWPSFRRKGKKGLLSERHDSKKIVMECGATKAQVSPANGTAVLTVQPASDQSHHRGNPPNNVLSNVYELWQAQLSTSYRPSARPEDHSEFIGKFRTAERVVEAARELQRAGQGKRMRSGNKSVLRQSANWRNAANVISVTSTK